MPTTRKTTVGTRAGYHHGNLRQALLDSASAIIDELGLDSLTLRACAARAGVSHAAPSHHFGNLRGLLTALSADAFLRFRDLMAEEQNRSANSDVERLRAAARGYLKFATRNPGLFRLIFSAGKLNWDDPALRAAGDAAYALLGDTVRPFQQDDSQQESDRLRVLVWSVVHGYAHLLLAGKFKGHGVSDDGLSHLPDIADLLCRQVSSETENRSVPG